MRGDPCPCGNEARYTTITGARACGLCSMGILAMKDSDAPTFIASIEKLMWYVQMIDLPRDELREHVFNLRGLLGRTEPTPVALLIPLNKPNKLADGFERSEALKVECPWCLAKPGEECNLAAGVIPQALVNARAVHDSRIKAAFPTPADPLQLPIHSPGKCCERCGGSISRMGVCDNCGDDSEGPYV